MPWEDFTEQPKVRVWIIDKHVTMLSWLFQFQIVRLIIFCVFYNIWLVVRRICIKRSGCEMVGDKWLSKYVFL